MNDSLRAIARAWIDDDPDPETKAQGEALLQSGDEDALREHFGQRLEFGTAGIRGALGFGSNRMNRAIVQRVSAGLGQYLKNQVQDACERGVVIGYDHRHGSEQFARDSAVMLASAGFKIWLSEHLCATPELAYALKHLHCAAGIMVTASHNPPQDNGYKVYWGNGAQIIPPHDKGISRCIDEITSLKAIPQRSFDALCSEGRILPIPSAAKSAYWAEINALRCYKGPKDISIVYTAMHGVGRAAVEPLLRQAGYNNLHMVEQQVEPDPDFSTVKFPNPEEPGALDLALAKAREVHADLLIANDPDADRLSVAVPDGDDFRVLTGNQVGALFGDELLRYGPQDGDRMVTTTIVSSSLLSRIAMAHNAKYSETLTGFKWIGNRALKHRATGGRFVMGYEEALGYSLGEIVPDKDGICAALIFCDLAARCKSQGLTLLDRLEALYREHGLHLGAQRSAKFVGIDGPEKMAALMDRLRKNPPKTLGGIETVSLCDYLKGEKMVIANGAKTRIDLPSSNVLGFTLDGGSRVLVRPSGTEPKVKFYFEIVRAVHGSLRLCQREAEERMNKLIEDTLQFAGV